MKKKQDLLQRILARKIPKRIPASFQIDMSIDLQIKSIAEKHKLSVSEVYRVAVELGVQEISEASEAEFERQKGKS